MLPILYPYPYPVLLLSNVEHGWAILTRVYGFWETSPNPFCLSTLVIADVLVLPATYLVGAHQCSVMLNEMCWNDGLLELLTTRSSRAIGSIVAESYLVLHHWKVHECTLSQVSSILELINWLRVEQQYTHTVMGKLVIVVLD